MMHPWLSHAWDKKTASRLELGMQADRKTQSLVFDEEEVELCYRYAWILHKLRLLIQQLQGLLHPEQRSY
jgi:hypothetical protein